MKRVFLLSLLLAFSLFACSKQPQQPPAPTVQQLPSPLTLSAEEDSLVLCCEEDRALLVDDSGLSVFRVDGSEVSAVLTVPDCVMPSSVTVCSNGKQYAFFAAVNGSPHFTVFICDGSGILRQKDLSKPVTTFAITDDYVVCGLGTPDADAFSCESIPIGSGNTTTADSATPMWRLAGSGNSCLYVDGNFAPYIFYPNTQQTDTLTINRDTAAYQNWPTLFFSDGAG